MQQQISRDRNFGTCNFIPYKLAINKIILKDT